MLAKYVPPFMKKEIKKRPDFCIASSEWRPLYKPRECWIKSRLKCCGRDDFFLIQIEPPVLYNDKVYGTVELDEVIVASRHEGYTVSKINEWPLYVHLIRLRSKLMNPPVNKLSKDDIEKVAWAELYPSLNAARKAMRKYK